MPDDPFERDLAAMLKDELQHVGEQPPTWTEPDAGARPRYGHTARRWFPWLRSSDAGPVTALGPLGLGAVLLVVVVAALTLSGRPANQVPSGSGSASPTGSTSETTAANPSHVAGTCPVTPITRVVGGAAPEVDAGGLGWRWAGVPWVAGTPEKVVWVSATGDVPSVSVVGTELDFPIIGQDGPVTFPATPMSPVSSLGGGMGVALLTVSRPGCWLVTATWSSGASSVVVAVSPVAPAPRGRPTAGPPGPTSAAAGCPATLPSETQPSSSQGPTYVDGPFHWLLPPGNTFRIGGNGDKLVLDSGLGWQAADRRIVALPVGPSMAGGSITAMAVQGDIPPGFGGGTMGVGITLPAPGCWAFVYLDAAATSTVIEAVTGSTNTPNSPVPTPSEIPGVSASCLPGDLTATAGWQGATGQMVGWLDVTNVGGEPCVVSGSPRLVQLRSDTTVLDQVTYRANPTDGSSDAVAGPVLLQPGDTGEAFLWWSNWCPEMIPVVTDLVVTLPAGGAPIVAGPTTTGPGFFGTPRCDQPAAGSTFTAYAFIPVRSSP